MLLLLLVLPLRMQEKVVSSCWLITEGERLGRDYVFIHKVSIVSMDHLNSPLETHAVSPTVPVVTGCNILHVNSYQRCAKDYEGDQNDTDR